MTCWGAVQEEGRRARSRQLALRRSAGSWSNFSLLGLNVCLRLYVHRHWLRLDLWTCYRCGRKACTASCRAVELTCRSDGGKGVGAMMAPVYGTVAGLSTGFHSTLTWYWQCSVNRQNHDRAKLKTHSHWILTMSRQPPKSWQGKTKNPQSLDIDNVPSTAKIMKGQN